MSETVDLYEAKLEDEAVRESREARSRQKASILSRVLPKAEPATGEEEGDGYEYVSLGEFARRMWDASRDYHMFLMAIGMLMLVGLVLALGQSSANLMIFFALVLLAFLAAIMLYIRWQDWRAKRDELEKAEMLYKAVKDAERRQGKATREVTGDGGRKGDRDGGSGEGE